MECCYGLPIQVLVFMKLHENILFHITAFFDVYSIIHLCTFDFEAVLHSVIHIQLLVKFLMFLTGAEMGWVFTFNDWWGFYAYK